MIYSPTDALLAAAWERMRARAYSLMYARVCAITKYRYAKVVIFLRETAVSIQKRALLARIGARTGMCPSSKRICSSAPRSREHVSPSGVHH